MNTKLSFGRIQYFPDGTCIIDPEYDTTIEEEMEFERVHGSWTVMETQLMQKTEKFEMEELSDEEYNRFSKGTTTNHLVDGKEDCYISKQNFEDYINGVEQPKPVGRLQLPELNKFILFLKGLKPKEREHMIAQGMSFFEKGYDVSLDYYMQKRHPVEVVS